ncbi:MAG: hypothetical protein ACI92I_000914 [Acidimicrobiales bacterium]|jgi:hypothetical protein
MGINFYPQCHPSLVSKRDEFTSDLVTFCKLKCIEETRMILLVQGKGLYTDNEITDVEYYELHFNDGVTPLYLPGGEHVYLVLSDRQHQLIVREEPYTVELN